MSIKERPTRPRRLRCLALAIAAAGLAAVSALGAIAPAATADSPWTPVTNPLGSDKGPNGPLDDPPGLFCSVELVISVVANHQQQRTIALGPPAAPGTVQTEYRGELILSFTSPDTGAAVTRDVSGPYDEVDYPDGSVLQTGNGNQWWTFGPHGRKNTGEPGAFLTTGPFVLFSSSTDRPSHIVTSFEAKHVTNLCTLLGGSSAPPAP